MFRLFDRFAYHNLLCLMVLRKFVESYDPTLGMFCSVHIFYCAEDSYRKQICVDNQEVVLGT
jgi:hypothetical protein